MMWQVDNDGNVINANQLFLDFLGANAEDKLNIFDPAVVNPSDYKSCVAAFEKGKKEKAPFTATRGLKCHNGKFYTYTAKAVPEFDGEGNVSSWFGTCFSEQAASKDIPKRSDGQSGYARSNASQSQTGGRLQSESILSSNEEKIDLINAKLGLDKNFSWFKVSQGMFTTLWLGISRTNVTILSKDKSEEIGNYSRSNFTVLSSTSNR